MLFVASSNFVMSLPVVNNPPREIAIFLSRFKFRNNLTFLLFTGPPRLAIYYYQTKNSTMLFNMLGFKLKAEELMKIKVLIKIRIFTLMPSIRPSVNSLNSFLHIF